MNFSRHTTYWIARTLVVALLFLGAANTASAGLSLVLTGIDSTGTTTSTSAILNPFSLSDGMLMRSGMIAVVPEPGGLILRLFGLLTCIAAWLVGTTLQKLVAGVFTWLALSRVIVLSLLMPMRKRTRPIWVFLVALIAILGLVLPAPADQPVVIDERVANPGLPFGSQPEQGTPTDSIPSSDQAAGGVVTQGASASDLVLDQLSPLDQFGVIQNDRDTTLLGLQRVPLGPLSLLQLSSCAPVEQEGAGETTCV